MGKYILKRVLQFIPVFLGVTLILFLMENVVPGDPIKLIAGEKKLDAVTEQNLRVSFHLIETDSDGNVIYPGTCRSLTPAEVAEKRKAKAPAYRLKVPDEVGVPESVPFDDSETPRGSPPAVRT